MNFIKLNVVNALPVVTSADAGARVLFNNEIYVVTTAGAWVKVSGDSYTVVNGIADLPASIPVGVQILTRDSGTMWRGLVAGESSLPAGTPWPVKGYKLVSLKLTFTASPAGVDFEYINNDGFEVAVSLEGTGTYFIEPTTQENQFTDRTSFHISPTFVYNQQLTGGGIQVEDISNEVIVFTSRNNSGVLTNLESDANIGIQTYFAEIRIYPPAPTP
jgi:hypothetical protein